QPVRFRRLDEETRGCFGIVRARPGEGSPDVTRPPRQGIVVADEPHRNVAPPETARQSQRSVRAPQNDSAARPLWGYLRLVILHPRRPVSPSRLAGAGPTGTPPGAMEHCRSGLRNRFNNPAIPRVPVAPPAAR